MQGQNERLDSFTLRYYLDHRFSSITQSTFSLSLSLISTVSPGLPYAFSDLNPPLATLLLCCCFLSSRFSSRILLLLADTKRLFYVDRFMNLATGRTGGWIWLIFSCLYLNGALALNLKQAGSVILLSLPDNWIQDNILNPCFPSSWVNADSDTFTGYVFGTELPSCIVLYAVVTVPFLIKFRSLPSISTLSLFSLVSYGCVIAGFCVDAVMRFKGGEGEGEDWLLPKPTSPAVIGTVLYCFGNGFNSLVIYNNLRMRRIERGLNVVERSSNISMVLVFLFTVSGFAAYLPRHNSSGSIGAVRINIFRHCDDGDGDSDDSTKMGMKAARIFFILFCYFKFALDLLLAKSAFKRLRRKVLACIGVGGKEASTTCYLCFCCFKSASNDDDEDDENNPNNDPNSERNANRSMADDSLFESRHNNFMSTPGEGGFSSSENSSARQSHDIQGGIKVNMGGNEDPLLLGGHVGGEDNMPQWAMEENEASRERESSHRRCCQIKYGRTTIQISLGLAVWLVALIISAAPKSAALIVVIGSANATFLGVILPAFIYLKLKPVNTDFGEIGFCGMVPNHWYAMAVIVFGVVAWTCSVWSGVQVGMSQF
ncbi:hypothetical protein TrLO_g2410 [Triparma laevis f. longispina]|uniref:Amino acid transporter transmembrane domain-containing protein n=1 Tax=Triparma laevis f. longispina TaxID=1714387 RepID=A0A9W7FLI3_9STRA|nr:hypothetical protein TrLO_g2410 [Triparma laevis f. longispina]